MIYATVLEVGDVTVATNLCLLSQRTVTGLMLGNQGGCWIEYSPGRLLLEWSLQDACNDPLIDVYDFSIGDETYKQGWAERVRPLYRQVRSHSFSARSAETIRKIGARSNRRARLEVSRQK